MNMYRFHFNCCRLPRPDIDGYAFHDSSRHHHVAVMRKNRLYTFDLRVKLSGGSERRLTTWEIAESVARTRAVPARMPPAITH